MIFRFLIIIYSNKQYLTGIIIQAIRILLIFYLLNCTFGGAIIFKFNNKSRCLAVEWSDIDFENHVIHIRQTSQYVKGMGIITKSPKNDSSERTIKLSDMVFKLLEQYRSYWLKLRDDLTGYWMPFIEITLADGSRKTVRNDRLFIKDDTIIGYYNKKHKQTVKRL